jgi:hypothetical protein
MFKKLSEFQAGKAKGINSEAHLVNYQRPDK